MSLVLGDVVVDSADLDVVYGPHLPSPLTWSEGKSRVSKRSVQVDLGVIHATGGEGDAKRVFRTLTTRGYSVHFVLERSGRVVQFLDPLKWTAAHVGGLNARSIGIEVVNSMSLPGTVAGRSTSTRIVQATGTEPGPYPDDFVGKNGKRLYYHRSNRKPCVGLLPRQIAALRKLVVVLSEHCGVDLSRDPRDYVPFAERAALRGWVGHVQVTLSHGDPSMDSLELIG